MSDNTPTRERRWSLHLNRGPNCEGCYSDAEVLATIGVTDEMIERAAIAMFPPSPWHEEPDRGAFKRIAERVLRAALEVEHEN